MDTSHRDNASKLSRIKALTPPVKSATMLQIKILILILMYIQGSIQDSKNNYSNNKLWLNENNKQKSTSNHHQYLYVLNDTNSIHNQINSKIGTSKDISSQPEETLDASESRLSFSSVSNNASIVPTPKSSTLGKPKQDKHNSKSVAKLPNTKQSKTDSNSKSKNGKFFKNPSKLSISSLLTKSKRQDMLPDSKARKVKTSRKSVSSYPRHGVLAQSRGFHLDRQLVPYAEGSHHFLFGSQLTLPDFYGHFPGHPAAELITGPLAPPPPHTTATIRHLNAQFQTQQTMPQPFHQSVAPLPDFRTSNELTPTIFFPAPAPPTKSNLFQDNTNTTSIKTSSANPVRNHQSNQTQKSKEPSNVSGNNSSSHHPLSLPLGAAAAALFSERAKSFISHLNRGGLVGSGSNKKKENTKDTRTTTPEPARTTTGTATSPPLVKSMSHDNIGLASMMKNAADSWAGTSTSSEAAPSILVEHDGPTITTVNFDQHHNLNGPIPHQQRNPYDNDDDDVNSYYESSEEEESEMGGSHDARRIVRYRGLTHHPHHQQQPAPHHQSPHHGSYLTHPMVSLRHLPQARHVPYPPRYPHSRYPFEQQVQSHTVHTEVPYDPFSSSYGSGGSSTLDSDYGEVSRKKSFGGGSGDFPQGALQDYLRQQRVVDQPQIYPDSINAIKEQNNGDLGMGKLGDLTSNIGSKLSASNSDQIDLLIKELQELNKMKRNQSMDFSSSNGRDSGSSDVGNKRKVKLSLMDADYDDAFGVGGGGGGSGGGNDDEDEEKFRLLRKKLLNRLRSKARGGKRGNNNAEDSFHSEAIKIPLHALLLAALDRRMSPSEAHSQSVASSASETGSIEHQRKWPQLDSSSGSGSFVNSFALGRQQDFNEITSGLGSLLTTLNDANPVDSETGSSSQLTSTDASSALSRNGFLHEFNKTPQLNQSADHLSEYQPAAPQTSSMFILNNIRLPDQLSFERGSNESSLKSTIESSLELIRKAQNESSLVDQMLSTQTTRTPSTSESSRDTAASKKRRQVQQQNQDDDIDVSKQMEEFTRDVRTDHLDINSDWATRKAGKSDSTTKRNHQQASSPSSVQFDDDFEEPISKAARSKISNRKRDRKPAKRDHSVTDSDDGTEDFLNKVQLDTEMDAGTHVEDPIGLASQEELNKREEKRVADELLNDSNNSPFSSSDADDNELELEHKARLNERDGPPTAGLWKPQVIDDEMQRLERLASKRKKVATDKVNLSDYTSDQDDNQVFDETDAVTDAGKVSLDSADTVMKVTIDSKDGSGARITQHFSGSKPGVYQRELRKRRPLKSANS